MENRMFQSAYAALYDRMYAGEKDYQGEVDALEKLLQDYRARPVRRLLDLGCGTGGHAILLAGRGYEVTGVDASPDMIALARQKAEAAGLKPEFRTAPMEALALDGRFDAVLCMFAAFSYLTATEAIRQTLATVRRHLFGDGLFIFDFWNSAAAPRLYEKCRVKDIHNARTRLLRISETVHVPEAHVLEMRLKGLFIEDRHIVGEFAEIHRMRYFSPAEIEQWLREHDFELLHLASFNDPGVSLEDAFSLQAVARRR